MPLEAASFIWLTPDPLDQFAQVHRRLKAEGLLASTLELDESQLDVLGREAALQPLLDAVLKSAKADDAGALVTTLRGAPAVPQKLNLYFRLEQPAKLTGKVRQAYEEQLGAAPPEDKLGLSPIAPFEVWGVFAFDDLQGTRVVQQSVKQKRSRLEGLSVPVWRLEDKPGAAQEPFAVTTSLELRTLSDDAAYLAFALERVGAWKADSLVLLRSL